MSAKNPTEDNFPMAVAVRPTIRFLSVSLKRNEKLTHVRVVIRKNNSRSNVTLPLA